VRAVSLYRTMQMEQPGLRREGVDGKIERVPPMNSSDVVKAAFAMKADDWSGSCTGDIDVYRTCGAFQAAFVLPFMALAVCIAVGWIVIQCMVEKTEVDAPVSADEWRKCALNAMAVHKESATGSADVRLSMKDSDHQDAQAERLQSGRNNENDSVIAIDMLQWMNSGRAHR